MQCHIIHSFQIFCTLFGKLYFVPPFGVRKFGNIFTVIADTLNIAHRIKEIFNHPMLHLRQRKIVHLYQKGCQHFHHLIDMGFHLQYLPDLLLIVVPYSLYGCFEIVPCHYSDPDDFPHRRFHCQRRIVQYPSVQLSPKLLHHAVFLCALSLVIRNHPFRNPHQTVCKGKHHQCIGKIEYRMEYGNFHTADGCGCQ